MKHSVQELNDIAKEARRVTMKCIASLGKGHVGGALDIVDALTVLYYEEMNIDPANPKMAGRDRLVLSKGPGSVRDPRAQGLFRHERDLHAQ